MGKKGQRARRAEETSKAVSAAASASTHSITQALGQATDAPEAPEAPLGRGSVALIALFLLYQVAMPLRYYLGGRGDDERFSWRMFSSVRLRKCEAHVHEVVAGKSRTVELGKAVQIAWIGMLERGRPQVVDKLLRRRCQLEGVSEARYDRSCTDTDGSPVPPLTLRMDCAHGTIEREGAP